MRYAISGAFRGRSSAYAQRETGRESEGERVKHICSSLIVVWMKGTSWSAETTVFVITRRTVNASSSSTCEWHSLLNACLCDVLTRQSLLNRPYEIQHDDHFELLRDHRARCNVRAFFYLSFFLLIFFSLFMLPSEAINTIKTEIKKIKNFGGYRRDWYAYRMICIIKTIGHPDFSLLDFFPGFFSNIIRDIDLSRIRPICPGLSRFIPVFTNIVKRRLNVHLSLSLYLNKI